MQCSQCGAPYDRGDHFCRNCGSAIPDGAEPAQRDPSVAAARKRRIQKAIGLAVIALSLLAVIIVKLAPYLLLAGGGKPRDLGVKWTQADYESMKAKTGVDRVSPPDGADRAKYLEAYDGSQTVDWTLTEQELSAWLNIEKQPGYWPFSDAQVKLHSGNVLEASLRVDAKKLLSYPAVSKQLPQEIASFIARVPFTVPVYLKAQVTFPQPKQAEIKMLDFDASGISASDMAVSDQANAVFNGIVDDLLSQMGPVTISGFTVTDGSLRVQGTWFREVTYTAVGK